MIADALIDSQTGPVRELLKSVSRAVWRLRGSGSSTASPMFGESSGLGTSGKHVLVVGSGISAFNVLLDLGDLAGSGTGTTWAVRKRQMTQLFGGQPRTG